MLLHPPSFLLLLLIPFVSVVFGSFSPKDLLSTPRRGPAIPNSNGTWAIYTESTYSFSTDSRTGGLYLLPLSTKHKHDAKLLINGTEASDPVWLSNSTLLYVSTKSGESTLRSYDTDTAKDHEIVSFPGSIGDVKALQLKNGDVRLAFSAKVKPNGDMLTANETETPNVLVYDKLWVRHWDTWVTPNKNSIFSALLVLKDNKWTLDHSPRNMLDSSRDAHNLESPVPPFGGVDDFSVSSTHLAFIAKDPHLNPATNTASHVYVVSFEDKGFFEQVNRGFGASSSPVWSPDGKYIAYLEMRVRGYEADRTDPSVRSEE